MTLTLLLLIFMLIAFFSANYHFCNRKKERVFQTALFTIYYRLHFIFYKLDFIFINFLCVTS